LTNNNLVGRCGLYCGGCRIYRAYKDSESLRQSIAKRYKLTPEEVRCEGCQALNEQSWGKGGWGKNCKTVKCLNAKGLNFCYECENYETCERFEKWASICAKIGVNLRENLAMIKAGRVEEWLRQEEERWTCQNCNQPTSFDLKKCHWCGTKLKRNR